MLYRHSRGRSCAQRRQLLRLNGVARMAASAHRADTLVLPYVENTSAAYEPKENRLEKAASHSNE